MKTKWSNLLLRNIPHPDDMNITRGQDLNVGNCWVYSKYMLVISYYLIHIIHRSIEYIGNSKAIFTIRVCHGQFFNLIGSGGGAA